MCILAKFLTMSSGRDYVAIGDGGSITVIRIPNNLSCSASMCVHCQTHKAQGCPSGTYEPPVHMLLHGTIHALVQR